MQPVYYPIEDYAQDVLKEARERATHKRTLDKLSKSKKNASCNTLLVWLIEVWRKITQPRPLPQGR